MSELSFRPKTSEIPTQPGVYRFLDGRGKVLYVGKAKNLKSRLTTYFGTFSKLHERTQRMLTAAADVKWTIVDTEYDALQLEFMWIKEFKGYEALVVTSEDAHQSEYVSAPVPQQAGPAASARPNVGGACSNVGR